MVGQRACATLCRPRSVGVRRTKTSGGRCYFATPFPTPLVGLPSMKIALFAVLVSVLVASAFATTQCVNGGSGMTQACAGPVRKDYSSSDCSGGVIAFTMITDGEPGDRCIPENPAGTKYSGSRHADCGTSYTIKSYSTNDCSGPYNKDSRPIGQCFKDQVTGTSHKFECASASTASVSLALLALMALLAILNL